MRNNSLTIMSACLVLFSVLTVAHVIKKQLHSGIAMASPGAEVLKGAQDARKDLRKTVVYHPENFLKLTGQDVFAVLKEPDLVRQDFPTVIWQYRTQGCVLDVYFASKAEDVSAARVVHYEVRARDEVKDEKVRSDCVRRVSRDRNGPRMIDVTSIYKAP